MSKIQIILVEVKDYKIKRVLSESDCVPEQVHAYVTRYYNLLFVLPMYIIFCHEAFNMVPVLYHNTY